MTAAADMLVTSAAHPSFARELRYYGNKFPDEKQITRELRRRSLAQFIRDHWKNVDPSEYVHGRHIDCVCDHLEAVTRGEIRHLIINVPPRHMKSIAVSVMWPAWEWMHNPGQSWLFASYAHNLSIRDSVKCRRILESDLYLEDIEALQPGFALTGDQNTKVRFETNKGGHRIASSVGGMLTGDGANRLVIDDPHNVMEGESEAIREGTLDWFFTSFATRMNDQRTGSVVIIMQRVHERDLTGAILARDIGYEHLCLPARCEGEDRVNTNLIQWGDWRTEQREPLWPERLPEEELAKMEKVLGAYAVAGQLQQRPSPREGGMYDVRKLTIVDTFDRRTIKKSVRYWDKAGTEGGGCETAGVLMHELSDGRYVVEDVVHGQWGADRREAMMKETAVADVYRIPPRGPLIVMEQEPGSGGKDSALYSARNLRGFRVKVDKVTGSKEERAEPFSSQVNVGNVMLKTSDWNDTLKTQLEMFPRGAAKDIADACSGAFNFLAVRGLKRVGVFGGKRDREQQPAMPAIAVPGQPVKTVRMKFISV